MTTSLETATPTGALGADRTVDVHTPAGGTDGTVTLPGALFDAQANIALMHQVVVAQLAAARQGTHDAKTRGEVAGGGTKPYRQKGTGRARQGSIRAPQFAGGGTVHGPTPHGYAQRTPKKMKAAALRGALSDRAREGRIHVLSAVLDGEAPSTKTASATLARISGAKRLLVVTERVDEAAWKSLRNITGVHPLDPGQLNPYDVLVSDEVVFTAAALQSFIDRHPTQPKADRVGAAAVPTAQAPDAEADTAADVPDDAPYGPDSHAPLEDGSEPEGFPIKGNADSMLYHVPGSAFYARTDAEVWFTTAEAAEAAGFALPPSQRDGDGAHGDEPEGDDK